MSNWNDDACVIAIGNNRGYVIVGTRMILPDLIIKSLDFKVDTTTNVRERVIHRDERMQRDRKVKRYIARECKR